MAFQDEGSLYELYRANCMNQSTFSELLEGRDSSRSPAQAPSNLAGNEKFLSAFGSLRYISSRAVDWHQRGERRWIFVFSYAEDRMTVYELDLKMQIYV